MYVVYAIFLTALLESFLRNVAVRSQTTVRTIHVNVVAHRFGLKWHFPKAVRAYTLTVRILIDVSDVRLTLRNCLDPLPLPYSG